MAVGTNAFVLDKNKLEQILPHLTYLRVNFSAGTRERYSEIMGVKPEWFDKVCSNIEHIMKKNWFVKELKDVKPFQTLLLEKNIVQHVYLNNYF